MTRPVDYHSWCPARADCTRKRCGHCTLTRSAFFRQKHKEYIAKLEDKERKREEYRERRRKDDVVYRQTKTAAMILAQTEQAIIAANPKLYADNIDKHTNESDLADPIPRWIAKVRRPYYYEGGNGSSLGSRTVW